MLLAGFRTFVLRYQPGGRVIVSLDQRGSHRLRGVLLWSRVVIYGLFVSLSSEGIFVLDRSF